MDLRDNESMAKEMEIIKKIVAINGEMTEIEMSAMRGQEGGFICPSMVADCRAMPLELSFRV